MIKCGFKPSTGRREKALVSDLIALGAGYRRDYISPPSQERSLKHCWDPVAKRCLGTVSQSVQG